MLPALLAALFSIGAATAALAHHPMGGETPSTVMQGLLSGLGHPILGLDHLAALVAVGLVASRFGAGALRLPVLWIVGMALGAFAHMRGIDLPGAEILIALSVVLIAALAAVRPPLPRFAVGALFAAAGFAHGHALAESIIGADAPVVGAYLVRLVAVQSALTLGTILAIRRLAADRPLASRALAAGLAGIGLVFLLPNLV